MRRLLVLVALFFSLPAQAVTIDWVPVGNPGNAPDTANRGSVAYDYWISKYETTNSQYAEFLNAKAASDPLGLYITSMGSDASNGGITRDGAPGTYTYAVKDGFENKPVTYVDFFDAVRFANWLNNGQGIGDTETGAYTLLGGTATPSNWETVTRNPGAQIFLTSENEWHKAAYFDGAQYFNYPAGSDAPTKCAVPEATSNTANCYRGPGGTEAVTDVGAYPGSPSPSGTFDQGGNVREWSEDLVIDFRVLRGGSWLTGSIELEASYSGLNWPDYEQSGVGFRVANLVPEPGPGLLGMTGVLSLAASRRRRAS